MSKKLPSGVIIEDDLYRDLKKFVQRANYKTALLIRDDIEKTYTSLITQFYADYPEPKRYFRHSNGNYDNKGLYRTYRPINIHMGNSRYYEAGIEVSTRDMETDYDEPQDKVLSTFMYGYHGYLPEPRSQSAVLGTQRRIVEIKKNPLHFQSEAIKYAATQGGYAILKFR